MPYKGIPESQWGKLDRCVQDVMAKGHEKDSAIAICRTSLDLSEGADQEMTSGEYAATDKESRKILAAQAFLKREEK